MIEKTKNAMKFIVKNTYKSKSKLLLLILALTLILTNLYLPQVLFAAQIQEKKTINITPTELPDKTDKTIINHDNDTDNTTDNTTELVEADQPDVPFNATTIDELEEENAAVVDDNKESTDNEEYLEEKMNENGRDLSNDPEYIKELEKIYSNEDLERLRAPRKWVTMPNVVGMSEADAVKTMRSVGLVARVIYEDDSWENEGICFMQEFNAGDIWNTDASFFIWIQRNEPEKLENMEELRETESADLEENELADLEELEPEELEENEPEGLTEEAEITKTPELEEDQDNIEIAVPTTEPSEQTNME